MLNKLKNLIQSALKGKEITTIESSLQNDKKIEIDDKDHCTSFYTQYYQTVLLKYFKIPRYIYDIDSEYLTSVAFIENKKLKSEKLLKNGYIREATECEKLQTLSRSDLVEICKKINISTSGSKKELACKIVESEKSESYYHDLLGNHVMYITSSIGMDLLNKNYDFIYLSQNSLIPPDIYIKNRNLIYPQEYIDQGKKPDYNVIATLCYTDIINKSIKEKEFYRLHIDFLQLSKTYMCLNDIDQSTNSYAMALLIILTCSNIANLIELGSSPEENITKTLNHFKNIDTYELNGILRNCKALLSNFDFPIKAYSDSDILSMIQELYENGKIDFSKYKSLY